MLIFEASRRGGQSRALPVLGASLSLAVTPAGQFLGREQGLVELEARNRPSIVGTGQATTSEQGAIGYVSRGASETL